MQRRLLQRLPLFAGLSAEEMQQLTAAAKVCKLQKGEVLFRKGEPCHGFYVVQQGTIKLALPARGGEKVVDIVHAGQSFGEAVMFLGKNFLVDAYALADATLIHIPEAEVLAGLDQAPGIARKMLSYLAGRVHRLLLEVEALALHSSRERLLAYLMRHLPECTPLGVLPVITLEASKGVLASRLGMTSEQLSRVFRELSDEGLIAVQGRRVTLLDLATLRLGWEESSERR